MYQFGFLINKRNGVSQTVSRTMCNRVSFMKSYTRARSERARCCRDIFYYFRVLYGHDIRTAQKHSWFLCKSMAADSDALLLKPNCYFFISTTHGTIFSKWLTLDAYLLNLLNINGVTGIFINSNNQNNYIRTGFGSVFSY